MSYFFSHLIYIVIAGVVIALVAFVTVVLAEKNEAERNPAEERDCSCGMNCAACISYDVCRKPEKKVQ